MIVELRKMIQNFIAQGNKPEDCELIMGFEFYSKFEESIKANYDIEANAIKKFMGIAIENSYYPPSKHCYIINATKMLKETMDKGPYLPVDPYLEKVDKKIKEWDITLKPPLTTIIK